jgi:type I restriction enzyme S subunit
MIMQDNEKKPALRFKGFTDPWEQRKLGEICDFITKGATPTTYGFSWQPDGVPFFRNDSIKDNVFVFGEFSYISEAANEVLKRSEVHGNDILIAITGDIGKVGIIPDTVEKANINQHIARVRIRKEALPYFVYQYLASDDTQKEYQKIKTGLSMPQLSLEQVRDIVVKIPEFNEQGKIADCLRRIDTLITLHQRKYEKLVNIKKSMLDKMFPQNGASVPEIRFKGFTDPWEQRKVGELLSERNIQAPMSDEYPLMAFIANEGVAPKGERYDRSALVNDAAGKLYKKTEFGDFIYSSNNLETGSIGLNKYGKASISPVYSIFEPTGLADSDFIGRRFVRKDFINAMVKWRQGVIYGQWRIHESDFVKIEVSVPKTEEQRRIGRLLDNLDTLITLHQRKLEKLQNIKKSCLEKMFV